jgi:hypothetical protein
VDSDIDGVDLPIPNKRARTTFIFIPDGTWPRPIDSVEVVQLMTVLFSL